LGWKYKKRPAQRVCVFVCARTDSNTYEIWGQHTFASVCPAGLLSEGERTELNGLLSVTAGKTASRVQTLGLV
jgi:hypothetical protein